jgi:hypothetical protein
MIIVIGWLIFSIVVGAAAAGRGRSTLGWALLALFISPLIAGVLLAVLPDLRMHEMLGEIRDNYRVDDKELRRNVERG